ncbi:hypothetical protein CHGG_06058 [Chaetomium globosum CBS 148.51]|uniref:Endonuclease/exonuclease/phosphatase domain-containing protein n=1 Tax=Chaetomium globosum (strain ATCC 6205 / CBS 148.51 / DSM 1962 / NBRC 6347 / NRRL 1970) TaxID=306901 RepID=Q2H5K7_CHAGB|nr:uncharacterized protein CHGG_06058 [Chaetomium globosum CBS 148.51]EAQ89439.1 hypothetical protein CHGG_06058 [Chaetomium globosum CBS 148.51]
MWAGQPPSAPSEGPPIEGPLRRGPGPRKGPKRPICKSETGAPPLEGKPGRAYGSPPTESSYRRAVLGCRGTQPKCDTGPLVGCSGRRARARLASSTYENHPPEGRPGATSAGSQRVSTTLHKGPQSKIIAGHQSKPSTKQGAIAARKLPSGDTVVTFNDSNTKSWHFQPTPSRIQQAFGEQAKEAGRTYAVLCFKCWKWGHIQRFCQKEALCGRCGTGAHGEGGRAGEALCPTQQGQVPCKCPCCGGRHPGWAKECPGRARAKKEAREAYQYRPRVFEPARTAAAEPITAPRSAFTYEKARPQEEEVLLWNTEGNKQALEALLEEAQYDLMAIQEPWINQQTKSTYCPRGSKYHLVHKASGRAAIFVSRKFDTGQWEYETSEEHCKVWFPGLGNSGLELWSIYNPLEDKTLLQTLLSRPAPAYSVVLAGDFNLHYPQWDRFGRYERKAEALLELALQWDLDLRTPAGTITRAPQGAQRGRTSTIDHFWASVGLQTTYYGLEYRGKSDHYPQILEADIGGPLPQQTQPGGWNWKMMDRRRVEAEAALLPEKIGLEDPGPQGLRAQVREQEGLKEAFNWLVEELQRIAEVATPRKKANRGHGSPWWSVEVQEAQGEARRAERECKAAPSEHNKERLNQGLRALAATINKEKTKTWRTTMQKATHKTDLLWSLERWARCRSFAPPDPPKLPALTGPPRRPGPLHPQGEGGGLSTPVLP